MDRKINQDALIEINAEGHPIAIVIRANFKQDGIKFITPQDAILQVGYMGRPAGYVVKKHYHQPFQRHTVGTQEVLFVRSGEVKVSLFTQSGSPVEELLLYAGDVIILLSGGHQIDMLQDSEIFEVKNGPYANAEDKTHF